jgi:AcrR family transcriptional regulator
LTALDCSSAPGYTKNTEHRSDYINYTEHCSVCKGESLSRRESLSAKKPKKVVTPNESGKLIRADARRNLELILKAALDVFEKSGVDAPVREIAKKAGVGIATLYRHFPERSDLIKAVVQQGVDACAEVTVKLAAEHAPGEAIALWAQQLVELLKTKRGLATALHSGNSSYQSLPDYFLNRLTPALEALLNDAKEAGVIRRDVDAAELLLAMTRVATPASEGDIAQARRMIALLVDGLRYSADDRF